MKTLDELLQEGVVLTESKNVTLVEDLDSTEWSEEIDEAKLSKFPGLPGQGHRELVLTVKVGHAGIVNRNGRYYPKELLSREIKKLDEKITSRSIFSNDQHPRREKTADGKVKLLDLPTFGTTTFIPLSISMNESGEVFSTGVVPRTDAGRNFAAVIRAGGRPGISTRGSGSTQKKKISFNGEEKEVDVVQDDFNLKTFDTVIDQSVADAGIREISESHQETELVKSDKVIVAMKSLKDWIAKYGEAHTSLVECLKQATVEDVYSLSESLHEGYRKVISEGLEKEVEAKLYAKFDEYLESVRKDLKEEELAEAQAEGIALFLKECGVDSDTAKALVESQALGDIFKTVLEEMSKLDEKTPKDESTQGDGVDLDEALANNPRVKELNESVVALQKELTDSKKVAKIAQLKAGFPYAPEIFASIEKNLNECENATEVTELYESQVDLLKTAGAKETKKGSAQFLPTDAAAVEAAVAAKKNEEMDLHESIISDAASTMTPVVKK